MPAKKTKTSEPQVDVSALAWMMAQLVSSVQSLADEVKEIKEKQSQAPIWDSVHETMDELQKRRKNYKSEAFKVLPYSGTYVDMNWEQKKNYRLPGLTFKTLEAANAYVAKHPNQLFDVVPV